MTLAQLIAQFRADADDAVAPYLWIDAAVTQWLNEAQEEACIRASLLHDSSTTAVCSITVTAGTASYPVHASVINITRAALSDVDGEEFELGQTDEYELDRLTPGWRTLTDTPSTIIHKDTTVRFGCIPEADGTLKLEVLRLPLTPMSTSLHTPEIAGIHHRFLVHWALYRAFSVPDAETVDKDRAGIALGEFTRWFGIRPDADTRRTFAANRPHRTVAAWM